MHSKALLATALASAAITSAADASTQAEQVLGVYVFHRHGDRTAKAWKPVDLTPLGASQVHSSGSFYRRRYVDDAAAASDSGSDSGSPLRVAGLSADRAVVSQLAVTAPVDSVLHNSAVVFLQGLYPPSATAGAETLANGTKVSAPLGGYQYIPVSTVQDAATAAHAESSEWLQGGSGCSRAEVSSNAYFQSADYARTYAETKDFYQSLLPVVDTTFTADKATFKNGYSIFDYINVATIHNSTIPSQKLLTEPTLDRLYNLASVHEWNLAYNRSEPVRAIAGSVLAGQVTQALQALAEKKAGAPRFNLQFGAYGTFMAFFGLAQLPAASPEFYGICNYASSMAFELVAPSSSDNFKPEDLSVRFLFANGTASTNELKPFPLFGQDKTTLSWPAFKAGMDKFAIADTKHWCDLCGKTDGQCAAANSGEDGNISSQSSKSGNGISKPVAGIIGALVTLVAILGVQATVVLLGGLRLVKKATLVQASQNVATGSTKA